MQTFGVTQVKAVVFYEDWEWELWYGGDQGP